jgi:hypothetical protein
LLCFFVFILLLKKNGFVWADDIVRRRGEHQQEVEVRHLFVSCGEPESAPRLQHSVLRAALTSLFLVSSMSKTTSLALLVAKSVLKTRCNQMTSSRSFWTRFLCFAATKRTGVPGQMNAEVW